MKKMITLFAISLFANGFAQHTYFGINYTLDAPDKSVMPKMSINNSFGASFHYQPWERVPLSFTYDGNWGNYASQSINQDFLSTTGTTLQMPIRYSSNMSRNMFGIKIMGRDKSKRFLPYLNGSIGVCNMNSRIYIGDPNHKPCSGCVPLEDKKTFTRNGVVYGAGGGVSINLSNLTRVYPSTGNDPVAFIDLGFNYLWGPKMSYLNINDMKDEPAPAITAGHEHPTPRAGETDYYANFVSISTGEVHEHKVAEIYNSPLQFFSFKVGLTVLF